MFDKPVARGAAGCGKVLDIGIKMSAAQQSQLLRLKRAVVCRYRLIGHSQMIARRDHHQKRRRADVLDIGARLIFGEQLHRLQRDFVSPSRRAQLGCLGKPLIGVGRGQGARHSRIIRYDRNHAGRLAGIARLAVLDKHLCTPQSCLLGSGDVRSVAADQRHLRDDAFDPAVERTDDKDMRAAVARTPNADPVLIHLREGAA